MYHGVKDHSFSKEAKFSEKLIFLTLCTHTYKCVSGVCERTKYMILYRNIQNVVCTLPYLVNIRKYNSLIESCIFQFKQENIAIFIILHLSRKSRMESNGWQISDATSIIKGYEWYITESLQDPYLLQICISPLCLV